MKPEEIEKLEIEMLLEAISRRYAYDFRKYAYSSIRRRILTQLRNEGLETITQLQDKVIHSPEVMARLLQNVTIGVTAFFRNPEFYQVLREKVLPYLKSFPFVRIWHVGCATGEEVYSMAVMLHEEGMLERAKLYATDINEEFLKKAVKGVYPLQSMKPFTKNYQSAGGKKSFSDYYTARYGNAIFDSCLRKNIVFAQHNLVTDTVFNEFNLILCRNVMIYFDRMLNKQTHELLYNSLCSFGFLALGDSESLKLTPYERKYKISNAKWKIYQRLE